MNKIINIPDAKVLINSLRSLGYSFESAVADIIDNSITAKSTKIDILYPISNDEELYMEIVDNGYGMSKSELKESMRFGSIKKEERSKNDLGRFGLGLKTASISQCKKFSVISKANNEINGFTWDLDLIKNSGKWEMLELLEESIFKIPNITSYIKLDSFTLVLWEKIDKLNSDVTIFNNRLDVFFRKLKVTEQHLALIFHRYINKGLEIRFNGNSIVAIDPFLTTHPKTVTKEKQFINTKTSNGKDEKVGMQVYVLPYHKDLSKKDLKILTELNIFSKQGFYIYRNNRLMIYGTWFRIKPKKELYKNARIAIDIPNTLDDMWSIDVKKHQAKIPGALLEQLKGEVSEAVTVSKRIYKYKGDIQVREGSIWKKKVDQRNNSVSYLIDFDSNLVKSLLKDVPDNYIAKFKKLVNLIEMSLPYKDIYNSVSQNKDVNVIDDDQKSELINLAISLVEEIKMTLKISINEAIEIICNYDPYISIKEELKEILI